MKCTPLILVIDLDNTLIYFDEEGISSSQTNQRYNIYARKEIQRLLKVIRELFAENIFLVLWSTGENSYVKHMLHILGITSDFDLIYGSNEADEAKKKCGCYKSPTYLLENKEVSSWVQSRISDGISAYPAMAIIDDRVDENTTEDDCYNFAFKPPPIELSKIMYSETQRSIICTNTHSLLRYAFILYLELVSYKIPKLYVRNKSVEELPQRKVSFVIH